MAAYVILDITVTDPVVYEDYKKLSGATVAQHGGTFLVRGGAVESLEGSWNPSRFVVIEFESAEQAKTWWNSEEYKIPKEIRNKASISHTIVVQGA